MTAIHLTTAALALATTTAFSPPTRPLRHTPHQHGRHQPLYSESTNLQDEDLTALSANPTLSLLPAGYGFSASMERILKDAAGGYYRADVNESVIDVMAGITGSADADMALVFEGEELKGLFTDFDYIKVRLFFEHDLCLM